MCDVAERSVWWTTNEGALTVSHQGGRRERIKTNTGGLQGGLGEGDRKIKHADDDGGKERETCGVSAEGSEGWWQDFRPSESRMQALTVFNNQ